MRALILLLCVASVAEARPRCRQTPGMGVRDCNNGALFEFAPASGAGLASVSELCDQVTLTGSASFCLKADGTMQSGGGQTISAVGSPASQTDVVCSNGSDCASAGSKRMVVGKYYKSPTTGTAPTGDFSMGVLFRIDATGDHWLIDQSNLINTAYLYTTPTGAINTEVYKAGGISSAVSGSGGKIVPGAWHVAVVTYDYVTDGTSALRMYLDGASQGTPVTTAVGPPAPNTDEWAVGVRMNNPAANIMTGNVRGAFVTESVLSAAQVLAMAHAVLADAPTGTRGEAFTFTRGSSKFCTNSTGEAGSFLPNNRPCIRNGGLEIEGATTNLAIRSAEFDSAAWTKTNVSAVTANTQTAVDGTLTAESLTSTVIGGLVESTAAAITGTVGSMSVFVRTTAGTQGMAIALRDTTAGADRCTATLTATTTYQWIKCSSVAITSTNNHTVRIYPGGTAGTGTIVAFGAQMEANSMSSSYIATAGTSVLRAGDAPDPTTSFPIPARLSRTEGCSKITIVPGWSGVAPNTHFLLAFNSATTSFRVPYLGAGEQAFKGYDGSHIPTDNATFTTGVAAPALITWSATANQFSVYADATPTTTAFTTMGAIDQFMVGAISGAGAMPVVIKGLMLGVNSTACGSTP